MNKSSTKPLTFLKSSYYNKVRTKMKSVIITVSMKMPNEGKTMQCPMDENKSNEYESLSDAL